MRAHEKVPNEKGTRSPPRHLPQQIPRGGISRARITSPAARITRQPLSGLPQTGCAPFPRTDCGTRRGPRDPGLPSHFGRRSRASQGKAGQARPCLSASSDERDRELGERRFYREAQGTRVSGQASGPPLFGVLFLAGQRKVPRPTGRNLTEIKCTGRIYPKGTRGRRS